MSKDIITVTSPLLPNLDEFNEMLKKIWASKWITNNGDFHKQLEKALEVETQLLIAKNLNYIAEDHYNTLLLELTGIQKQLTGLLSSIRS